MEEHGDVPTMLQDTFQLEESIIAFHNPII